MELILSWALHFVGWVEPTPGFVGFRCTQPNLHFAGGIAKCETQQRPISELSPGSLFLDQTGRSRPAAALNPNIIEREKSLKFIARINEKVKWIMAAVDPAPEPGPFAGFENALNKSI